MSIPKHTIHPVTAADLPTLVNFLLTSKLQLAINRFLFKDWPNESAQRAIYTGAVEGGFKDPESTTLKVVDNASGEIVGHLVLTRRKPETETPATSEAAEKQNQQQDVPEGFDPEVLSMVMKMIKEVDVEMKSIEHIQITHIYVRPCSRNQGVGSQLVQLSIEKAKAAGLPLGVASEPQAHGFFLKHGFRETRHFDVDLSQWAPAHCGWGMFRLSGLKMAK